jgi:putative transposase
VLVEDWRQHYNTIRPHSSLNYRPPAPETSRPQPMNWSGMAVQAITGMRELH